MDFYPSYIILAAFILDLIIGDPLWLFHPVRWMGMAIARTEPVFRRLPVSLILSGTFFSIFLVVGSWGVTCAIILISGSIHPAFRHILEVILIYYCISASSLKKAAMDVHTALESRGLPEARKKVSSIVGRETRNLTEQGVVRASIETVAENLVDGIISPLFYAAIGGAPLAIAYKMINTLDSMVGYKNNQYIFFGKASARLDDIANLIPARLSVPVIALAAEILGKTGKRSFMTAVREGANHASPNSGYSEAAFAGALGVKLSGPNVYHGKVVNKPFIGTAFGDVKRIHILKACDLMLLSSFLWVFFTAIMVAMQ